MTRQRLYWVALAVWAVGLVGTAAADDTIIKLKKEFVQKYRTRVTIDAEFTVDKVGKVKSPADDGDCHMAGRSAAEIGLPIVAEIKNARTVLATAVINARGAAEANRAVPVTGVWRLWCEHANGSYQEQGKELQRFTTTNPAHVFEIHPVTRFDGESLLNTVGPIPGYRYKTAAESFAKYENAMCRIIPDGDTVTIRTRDVGYNHPEFVIQYADKEPKGGKEVADGRFLMAQVQSLDGEILVRKVRLAFVKGTDAEKVAARLTAKNRVRVVAMPRISLALVNWRMNNADSPRWKALEPLTWNLPYELVVLAVTGELPDADEDVDDNDRDDDRN